MVTRATRDFIFWWLSSTAPFLCIFHIVEATHDLDLTQTLWVSFKYIPFSSTNMERGPTEQTEHTPDTVSVSDSAKSILEALTPQEFEQFYIRAFRADHSEQGGVRQSCEHWPWFQKVEPLFREDDTRYLRKEAMQEIRSIALLRNLVGGFASDIATAQKRYPHLVS